MKKGNKISYINTNNSNSVADTKVNSNSIKSSNITPQSNYKDLERKKNTNKNNALNIFNEQEKDKINNSSNNLLNNIDEINLNNITNKIPKNFFENLDSFLEHKNTDEKDGKNYSNIIQYLEKCRDFNYKLIESLESEKSGEKKIDLDKRKQDVEYLEHVLDYISNLGENKDSKDLIPFYLIDKRKLFENMYKYLYSKDEMIHSTKPKNVRLYKYTNKPK